MGRHRQPRPRHRSCAATSPTTAGPMLDGEAVDGPGRHRLLGVDDPRSSGLGSWRDETGLSFDEVGDRLADAACEADATASGSPRSWSTTRTSATRRWRAAAPTWSSAATCTSRSARPRSSARTARRATPTRTAPPAARRTPSRWAASRAGAGHAVTYRDGPRSASSRWCCRPTAASRSARTCRCTSPTPRRPTPGPGPGGRSTAADPDDPAGSACARVVPGGSLRSSRARAGGRRRAGRRGARRTSEGR